MRIRLHKFIAGDLPLGPHDESWHRKISSQAPLPSPISGEKEDLSTDSGIPSPGIGFFKPLNQKRITQPVLREKNYLNQDKPCQDAVNSIRSDEGINFAVSPAIASPMVYFRRSLTGDHMGQVAALSQC
jgi:hypothetical protein